MSMLDLIIAGLATYRLARFSVKDDGPFNVFGRWRALCGVVDGVEPKAGSMADLVTCSRCATVWAAIAISAILLLYPDWSLFVILPLSLAAIGIFLSDLETWASK